MIQWTACVATSPVCAVHSGITHCFFVRTNHDLSNIIENMTYLLCRCHIHNFAFYYLMLICKSNQDSNIGMLLGWGYFNLFDISKEKKTNNAPIVIVLVHSNLIFYFNRFTISIRNIHLRHRHSFRHRSSSNIVAKCASNFVQ